MPWVFDNARISGAQSPTTLTIEDLRPSDAVKRAYTSPTSPTTRGTNHD